MFDGQVIGHLQTESTRTIWRHIKSNTEMVVDVYDGIAAIWENLPCFSMHTRSLEIGIRIRLENLSRDDCKLFMAYVTRHRINSFPGVTNSNCPERLRMLAFPFKDENHVSSLMHADTIIP